MNNLSFLICGFGLLFALEGTKTKTFPAALLALLAVLEYPRKFPGHFLTPVLLVSGVFLFRFLLKGLRERLRFSPVPKAAAGLPILLLTAALLALALSGFQGVIP